jgi:hypothetical protein
MSQPKTAEKNNSCIKKKTLKKNLLKIPLKKIKKYDGEKKTNRQNINAKKKKRSEEEKKETLGKKSINGL